MLQHLIQPLFLISAPGGSEWILIILAVLILFGGKKIPEFMRGLGKGMREFNDAKNNVRKEFEDGMNEPPAAKPNNTANTTPTSTTTTNTTGIN
jgi:sec-independent protein translocase protein TatA